MERYLKRSQDTNKVNKCLELRNLTIFREYLKKILFQSLCFPITVKSILVQFFVILFRVLACGDGQRMEGWNVMIKLTSTGTLKRREMTRMNPKGWMDNDLSCDDDCCCKVIFLNYFQCGCKGGKRKKYYKIISSLL